VTDSLFWRAEVGGSWLAVGQEQRARTRSNSLRTEESYLIRTNSFSHPNALLVKIWSLILSEEESLARRSRNWPLRSKVWPYEVWLACDSRLANE